MRRASIQSEILVGSSRKAATGKGFKDFIPELNICENELELGMNAAVHNRKCITLLCDMREKRLVAL
jgi:hypothetical protein